MYEIKENSIELWAIEAEKLFKQDAQPMSDELSKAFVFCFLNEKEMENDTNLRSDLEAKKLGYCSVFHNRVKYCHTYKVTLAVSVFMGFAANSFVIPESTIGEVTIYANYLQYQAHKYGTKDIDIDFISTRVFPFGFPSKETLQKVWDMQKVERKDYGDSDNLLDYQKCQESISFKD